MNNEEILIKIHFFYFLFFFIKFQLMVSTSDKYTLYHLLSDQDTN